MGSSDICYAKKGSYKLESFVKTKEFNNFNDLLQALKLRGGTLISYKDYGTFIKANIRYKGGK